MWNDKRLIIIGGKGGVGRTTVAVALSTLLARQGRRVLLAHVRSKQHIEQMLGCEKIDEEIRLVEPNLWVVNMTPEAALREKGLLVLRFKAIYKAVMENRLVKYFLRAVPSLNEYAMLGKVWYHTTEMEGDRPRFDTVVMDGPAMGHLITMLRIPQVILDTVPEGPLTSDAREARKLLRDPRRTGLWIVTLGEEMPVREAIELFEIAGADLRMHPDVVVANALYPDLFDQEPWLLPALEGLREHRAIKALLSTARMIASRRRINRRYLELLSRRIPLPLIPLPHLFVTRMDREAVDQLAAAMEEILTNPLTSKSERQ